MSKRGDDLREQMLFAAKDVFLELGFERASMDEIAARAGTTKRTLYAHFENKEKLFLAVIELARTLLLERMKMPGDCANTPEEALVFFCGKFLEVALWNRSIRMYRLTIAEVERFPGGAAQLYESMFAAMQERAEAFLHGPLGLSRKAAARGAAELLGRVLYPRFLRALFGLDGLKSERLSDQKVGAEIDLKPIRAAVKELLLRARE